MEVTITKFRRELFDLMALALKGEPLLVTHKGSRFRIVPETHAGRFGGISPLQVINAQSSDLDEAALKKEMANAWERDWDSL